MACQLHAHLALDTAEVVRVEIAEAVAPCQPDVELPPLTPLPGKAELAGELGGHCCWRLTAFGRRYTLETTPWEELYCLSPTLRGINGLETAFARREAGMAGPVLGAGAVSGPSERLSRWQARPRASAGRTRARHDGPRAAFSCTACALASNSAGTRWCRVGCQPHEMGSAACAVHAPLTCSLCVLRSGLARRATMLLLAQRARR